MALGLFQKPSWPNEISRPWFRVTADLQWVDDFPARGEDAWFARLEDSATPVNLSDRGDMKVIGSAVEAARPMDLFDRYLSEKAVVVPLAAFSSQR